MKLSKKSKFKTGDKMKVFCIILAVCLVFVQIGFAEPKLFSEKTVEEVLSGGMYQQESMKAQWENIKMQNATLGELSKSINKGVKWGLIEYSFVMTAIVIVAGLFASTFTTQK